MTNPKVPADAQALFSELKEVIEREFLGSKLDFRPSGHGGGGIWHAVVLGDFSEAYRVLQHPRVQELESLILQETSVTLSIVVGNLTEEDLDDKSWAQGGPYH